MAATFEPRASLAAPLFPITLNAARDTHQHLKQRLEHHFGLSSSPFDFDEECEQVRAELPWLGPSVCIGIPSHRAWLHVSDFQEPSRTCLPPPARATRVPGRRFRPLSHDAGSRVERARPFAQPKSLLASGLALPVGGAMPALAHCMLRAAGDEDETC